MRKNIIIPKVGDIVEVKMKEGAPFECEVKWILKRFGTRNLHNSRTNPLVRVDIGAEDLKPIDCGYITKLVKRGNKPQPKINIFRNKNAEKWLKLQRAIKTNKKGIVFGPFTEILNVFLGKLDEEIVTYTSPRAFDAYMKNPLGLIEVDEYGFIRVRAKYFGKWFAKNWKKCLMTYNEMDACHNSIDDELEKDYIEMINTIPTKSIGEYGDSSNG